VVKHPNFQIPNKMINYDKLEKISEPGENWKYLIGEDRKKNENFVVSNFGRVYSAKYNRLVKLYHNKQTGYDYFFINEYRDKNYDTMNVHRAVALTWLDIPTDLKDDYYVVGKHPIKYPFSLSYFHSTFACAILHELLTYFHYDKRTIYLFTGTASFKRSESSEISAT